MEQPEHDRQVLSFSYERIPGKPTIAATGALGGPSPDAQSVVAQLYVEHASVPTIISHPVMDDGSVDLSPENAQPIARGDATREIQATLVLSPEAAISIGEWLFNHGKETMKRRNTRLGGGN